MSSAIEQIGLAAENLHLVTPMTVIGTLAPTGQNTAVCRG